MTNNSNDSMNKSKNTKHSDKKQKNNEEACKKRIAELEDSLKRVQADFLNFKRRTELDRVNSLKYSGSQEILKLLPVFDNFSRAFMHIPEELLNNEWVKGVMQIEQFFVKTLNDMGVKKIECVGMPANHIFHEVISQTKGKKDIIIQEVETGYMYHDKVLRVAKVIVGDGSVK